MEGIEPQSYMCVRAPSLIVVDGDINEPAWEAATWTSKFRDIEGDSRPAPRFATRAKLLWDDSYLYVAARLEETHVWATLTERNSIIYHDNDFEVFIDPDGDRHNYYEFEVNAFNTVFELTLPRPYIDQGKAELGTNLDGLQSAIQVEGTINDPRDIDTAWTVELAIPWSGLQRYSPAPLPPSPGDQWRLNFSRVQWQHEIVDGAYRKVEGMPENNWVWSPQGVIDMHRPEKWGYLQFANGEYDAPVTPDSLAEAKDLLMLVYYSQRAFWKANGRWGSSFRELGIPQNKLRKGAFEVTSLTGQDDGYRAEVSRIGASSAERLVISQSGRIRHE